MDTRRQLTETEEETESRVRERHAYSKIQAFSQVGITAEDRQTSSRAWLGSKNVYIM